MTDRELTYADLDDAPPPEDPDEPTAADAARFLLRLFERSPGRLPLREAVERFAEEFGGRFLAGRPGEWGIDPDVRHRFEELAGAEVLWDGRDRCWRWRQPGDLPPGAVTR
jgi:hypothetical protein